MALDGSSPVEMWGKGSPLQQYGLDIQHVKYLIKARHGGS